MYKAGRGAAGATPGNKNLFTVVCLAMWNLLCVLPCEISWCCNLAVHSWCRVHRAQAHSPALRGEVLSPGPCPVAGGADQVSRGLTLSCPLPFMISASRASKSPSCFASESQECKSKHIPWACSLIFSLPLFITIILFMQMTCCWQCKPQ